jgi:imidazolonepropionase-like amidohydrolase
LRDLIIRDATLLDCTGQDPVPHRDILVAEGRIERVVPSGSVSVPPGTLGIDATGCTLMPGLTDAHVHLALIGPTGDHNSVIEDWVTHVLRVKELIERTLQEGFTTVRDAGGLEPAYAGAVAAGRINGPRILPSGSVLSQTGGHGDLRARYEEAQKGHSIPGLIARPELVDGADAMRRAAREQLRRGATQLKVFASGGVMSPTDPLESLQFSQVELAAAVEVAESWGTYVLAHCHTSAAIHNAVRAGVRSIEHGSVLTPEAGAAMVKGNAFLVPTLRIMQELAEPSVQARLSPAQREKSARLSNAVRESVRIARDGGVRIGSGSDLTGPDQLRRGGEMQLKASIIGNHEAILSATRVNAELFNLADRIGSVEIGKEADLILVDGQPLDHVDLLGQPARIPVVIKGGVVAKDSQGRAARVTSGTQ